MPRGRVSFAGMTDFQCWFCGHQIARSDAGAVMLQVESLWRWAENTRAADDPCQSIYAHSECAKDRLAGATMKLEPSMFGEDG